MSRTDEILIATGEGTPERPMNWPAAFAGAAVAIAVAIILMLLASGIGLAVVSPWSGEGVSAKSALVTGGIALIVIQWIASAAGGYVAGRMRAGWAGLRSDEAFFRDTVHGLVAWTVAALIMMGVAASSAFSVAGTGVKAAATVAGATATAAGGAADSGLDYYVDSMMRPGQGPSAQALRPETLKEVSRIIARAVATGTLPQGDKTYVTGVIANATGVSQADAEQRVNSAMQGLDNVKQEAKQKADDARKASAATALAAALALCIGAFVACVAAVLGGRARDEFAYGT